MLQDPHLADLVDGHTVDDTHVVLRWGPVPGAERYRVQIALDPAFRDVAYQQDLPGAATALVVRQRCPERGRTYHWRALAGDTEGWSAGAQTASFACARAESVGHEPYPGVSEPFGPVAALFSATALDDLAAVRAGRRPGVEGAERFSLGVALLVVAAVVVAVGLVLLFASC